MGLTVKLTIVGAVVWIIAVIIEMVWYAREDRAQEAQEEKEGQPPNLDSSSATDESAIEQKVG
jgi:FtsZ-interacting cell division protein ZipA